DFCCVRTAAAERADMRVSWNSGNLPGLTRKSHPQVEEEDSRVFEKLQPFLQLFRSLVLLAPSQLLEPGARLIVQPIGKTRGSPLGVARLNEVAEKRPRRELAHLLAGRPPHRQIGRD